MLGIADAGDFREAGCTCIQAAETLLAREQHTAVSRQALIVFLAPTCDDYAARIDALHATVDTECRARMCEARAECRLRAKRLAVEAHELMPTAGQLQACASMCERASSGLGGVVTYAERLLAAFAGALEVPLLPALSVILSDDADFLAQLSAVNTKPALSPAWNIN